MYTKKIKWKKFYFFNDKTSPFQVEFVLKPDKTKVVDFGIDGASAAKFLQSVADNVFNTLPPVLLV